MQCPQCGSLVPPQALQCDHCGYVFRGIGSPSRPRPMSGGWPQPPDVPGATGQLPIAPDPFEGSSQRDPSGMLLGGDGLRGQTGSMPLPFANSGGFGAGLRQGPPSGPIRPGMLVPYVPPVPPAQPVPPLGPMMAPGNMLPPPGNMVVAGSLAPFSNIPSRPRPSGDIIAEIGPGVVLQRGRLRIILPFAPLQSPPGRAISSGPQWVATDAGRRGDKVILLELPLGNMPLTEASHARETIATRLDALGEHPGLPHLLGAFSEQGHHFIVFEFIDGEFLADRITRIGALPERQVFTYATQILEVIQFLEKQSPPLVHGLIVPEMILVDFNGRRARLATYTPQGLARWAGIALNAPLPLAPGFTAPEIQRERATVSVRGDLYSLGATLFAALTNADSRGRTAGIYPSVRSANPIISGPADQVVAKALRVIPAQRYQHAEEMALDVQRALAGESPGRDPLATLEPIAPARSGQTIAFTLAGVLAAVLAVILVFVLATRPAASVTRAAPTATLQPTVAVDPTLAALAAKGEGLSTGLFIFDVAAQLASPGDTATTATPAGAEVAEIQGADALNKHDLAKALSSFQRAVQDDPSNAEARIYLADTQIAVDKSPYVSLDIAVNFEGADLETSREVLRGAALAQASINSGSLIPNGTRLQIEIASVGNDAEAAQQVAQYSINVSHSNASDYQLGVMSWASKQINPAELQNLTNALSLLIGNGFPVIAPVTTTDALPNVPGFFRLSPKNLAQGDALATEALTRSYYTETDVVFDKSNPADAEVAQEAYKKLANRLGGYALQEPYDTSVADQGVAAIQKIAQNIAYHGSSAVVFAGNADAVVLLVKDLLALNYTPATLPAIYASSMADSPDLIGAGTSPTAQFAFANEAAMTKVSVLGLADSAEWQFLIDNKIAKTVPTFFKSFGDTFTPLNATFPLTPTVDAILSFDSVSMVMNALLKAQFFQQANQALPQAKDLAVALSAYTADAPYQGISGRIGFTKDPAQAGITDGRSMVLKGVAISTQTNAANQPLLAWKVLEIVGTPNAFCDIKNGCPPPA